MKNINNIKKAYIVANRYFSLISLGALIVAAITYGFCLPIVCGIAMAIAIFVLTFVCEKVVNEAESENKDYADCESFEA